MVTMINVFTWTFMVSTMVGSIMDHTIVNIDTWTSAVPAISGYI
jgi:hypothetical protein